MQLPQSTILLISSQHPNWDDVRLSLEAWPHGQVVGDVQRAAEAIALASILQPRVILVDADAPDRPLVSFVGDLRAASPASRIMVLGARETLDHDVLMAPWHRGLAGYLVWEGLRAETLLHGMAMVVDADVLVGSRVVWEALLVAPERRRRPRIAGLVLSEQERAALTERGGGARPSDRPAPLGAESRGLFLIVGDAAPTDALVHSAMDTAMTAGAVSSPVTIAYHGRATASGEVACLPPEVVQLSPQDSLRSPGAARAARPLTPREHEVLQLIGAGVPYKRIAARLHVAESTVKTTVRSIKDKLDLVTREDLVAAARRLSSQKAS
jgi:DNA-binding NarL/FixJ family response regulator